MPESDNHVEHRAQPRPELRERKEREDKLIEEISEQLRAAQIDLETARRRRGETH